MYLDKLAVAIKHNGKILRETKDIVHIPFGSEFSVLVKNLNSKRVTVSLHIDGADALDGERIVVNANSETEIKRFIRNGNMNEGNAFKFIERTKSIEDGPRGIKIDDGIVRVEFCFEQDKPEVKVKDIYWEKHHYIERDYWRSPFYTLGSPMYGYSTTNSSIARGDQVLNQVYATSATPTMSAANAVVSDVTQTEAQTKITAILRDNDVGITVPGSKVEQKFTTVYGFIPEATSHTIILRLVGKTGEVEITEPITVKTKPKCSTCGKLNKATSKFCTDCGTALNLI